MGKFQNGKHLREGDKVVAIAGNDKGKTGVVLSRLGDRVLVQGINMRKKHVKKSQEFPQGGIIDREGSLHVSNIMNCNEDGKPLKLKVRVNNEGARELVYHDNGQEVLYRPLKKSK